MARYKKKTTEKQKFSDPFSKLTWEEVEQWAGNVIIGRGRSYQRNGAVENLGRTEDWTLVAWVRGTRPYATRVRLTAQEDLEAACTCPYRDVCKHAVAVVLEYLECLKTDSAVGEIDEDDPRLLKLEAMEDEYDEYDEEGEEENVRARSGHSKPKKSKAASLLPYLQEQTKAELIAMVIELADAHDAAHQWLADHRDLASGQTDKILQTIRREIRALEAVWEGYDYRDPSANLVRLKAALKGLVAAGQADAVVQLGPELLAVSNRALESEGESDEVFADCLEVLFQALDTASLSPAEQIEWAIDMEQADEYGLCAEGLARLWKRPYAKGDWSAVCDRLAQRLEAIEPNAEEDGFFSNFKRSQIADWLIRALEKAGRQDEIIPLCEREAPITYSYELLVDRLMDERRWEEARHWCHQGIEAVAAEYPGVGEALRGRLQTINQRSGNPLAGLAIQAEEFFVEPSLAGFQDLCAAACEAHLGKGVEAWARHYLETGRRPGVGRKRKSDPAVAWPLPPSEVEVRPDPDLGAAKAPMTGLLTRLAIAEKKPDEALKWYDYASRRKGGLELHAWLVSPTELAEVIKSAHPDRAIAIWQEVAERNIARVETKGYEEAAPYLRKMKEVLTQTGRKREWDDYLASLREENSRRPRCLEMLDRL